MFDKGLNRLDNPARTCASSYLAYSVYKSIRASRIRVVLHLRTHRIKQRMSAWRSPCGAGVRRYPVSAGQRSSL